MLSSQLKPILLKKEDPFTDILGQEEAKAQIKGALLTNRHILIVGAPGIGKTTMAKNIAKILPELTVNDCGYNCIPENAICPVCKNGAAKKKIKINGKERFIRVQGSPDLTVEDLIGDIEPIKAMKFGPLSLEAFTPGKIFKANNGVLFFDELNRAPEKLQNALLQVLEEGYSTIGSYVVDIPSNFIFIATMNPEETTATEKLSDVLLDRFDMVYMAYPEDDDTEKNIVKIKSENIGVNVNDDLLNIIIGFVRDLRKSEQLVKKPSVRASIGLYERVQSNAMVEGKKEADFEDLKKIVISVLAHRIKLKPSLKYMKTSEEFIKEHFDSFISRNYPKLKNRGEYP